MQQRLIVLLAVMGLMGTDLFAPSLPAIAVFFHQTPAHTQLSISLFLLGFSISQLFYGPLSDTLGRKPLLVLGTAIFTIGSIVCLWAPSFEYLCIGRIIQGIGVGGGLSLARVVLRDLYQGTELAIRSSQIALFVSLTPAVAPFIGGVLQEFFNFKASFVFMLVYGVLLLILLLTVFKESNQQKENGFSLKNTLKHYKKILGCDVFMRYVIIAGFTFASIVLFANILPFIIQNELHLSAMQNGIILLIAAIGVSVGSFVSAKITVRLTPERMVMIGLQMLAVSGLLLMITPPIFGVHLFLLMPLIFSTTAACGFLFPNAVAVAFSSVHEKIGTAGAIYGSTQIAISTAINFLLNLIPHQGQALLGAFYFVLGLLGIALLLFRKPKKILN